MIRICSILILSLISLDFYSQGIYEQYNHKNFRKSKELQQEIDPGNFRPELLNSAIFFATNEIRAKKKLRILDYHPKLERAATIHSDDMAKDNFFGHTNPKNARHREPEDRARRAGINNPKLAENVAEGFLLVYKAESSVIPGQPGEFFEPGTREPIPPHTYLSCADQLLKSWMNSKGHRKNILSVNGIEHGAGTSLFFMKGFNEMPAIKATQNFQWFEPVK